MENIKIKFVSNFIISFISALGTLISMSLGSIFLKFLNKNIANDIGSFILIAIGLYFCFQFFNESKKYSIINNPILADKDNSKVIESHEACSLAFALTINNFGVGFGASVAGLNILFTSIVTFFMSSLFLEIGDTLGSSVFSKIFGKYSGFISGILIIFIGFYELL